MANVNNVFGPTLRRARRQRRLSGTAAAGLIGLPMPTLCQIELCRRSCSVDMAVRVLRGIGYADDSPWFRRLAALEERRVRRHLADILPRERKVNTLPA